MTEADTTAVERVSIVIISRDESALAETLARLADHLATYAYRLPEIETIIVDASGGRLDHIRAENRNVRWIDFVAPRGVGVTIPHQRNAGVQASTGQVIIFTDAGCVPEPEWLINLLNPILTGDESVTCGPSSVASTVYSSEAGATPPEYVEEAPTINLAFRRELFTQIGGFDESFEYGSDIDFTWRLADQGVRLRWVADAVVSHDWGGHKRQLKRSIKYGAARVRLYRKHKHRRVQMLRKDPVPIVYGAFILGLPLALRHPAYLLLLLIPLWRARYRPFPAQVVINHLVEGLGGLEELGRVMTSRLA